MNGDVWIGIGIGFVLTNALHLVLGLCIAAARSDRAAERLREPHEDPEVTPLYEHAERPHRGHHHHRGA